MPTKHDAQSIAEAWAAGSPLNVWKADRVTPNEDELRLDGEWHKIGQKMKDDMFCAYNTDLLMVYLGTRAPDQILKSGVIWVPISFEAAFKANVLLRESEVIYSGEKSLERYGWGTEEWVAIIKYDGKTYACLRDTGDTIWNGILWVEDGISAPQEFFDYIKPAVVHDWEKETGFEARRQGEWYAIPKPDMEIKSKDVQKNVRLEDGNHVATQYSIVDGKTYARGTIRHRTFLTGKERSSWCKRHARKMLTMDKYWHEIHRANYIESYRARSY